MKKIIVEKRQNSENKKAIPYEVHFDGDRFVKVEIMQINLSFTERNVKPIYGISTAGYGTSDVKWHEDYLKLINKAIELAKELNK